MIETSDLKKRFRVRGRVIEAVKGVDIHVRPGETYGFLGPNGAGKTTTMRMLTTLLKPSAGTARIAGYDLFRESQLVRRKIGYVSQAGGAEGTCSGRENLVLQGRMCGLTRALAHERAAELLSMFEMTALADRRVNSYSGGQRRRLELALGMVHRPVLLFLDEPTVGLDPQSRNELWNELRKLQQAGTTIFMSTHYLDEADALCHRLAIMDDGRIAAEGSPAELKRQITGDTVMLGMDMTHIDLRRAQDLLQVQPFVRSLQNNEHGLRLVVEHGEGSLPQILRLMDDAGLYIHTISLAHPTLDDVFLKQTGRSIRTVQN
jgi:ABC-2 type transport system ATP-binding protein